MGIYILNQKDMEKKKLSFLLLKHLDASIYKGGKQLKKLVRIFAGLLIFLNVSHLAIPMPVDAASSKYGVILNDSKGIYHLYNDLIVISPAGNLMIKADSVSKKLGLTYSYDKNAKKLTIKNPINKKSLVYTIGSDKFVYYSSEKAKGQTKTAVYKAYYDTKSESVLIHIQSLKYIVSYNYYKGLKGTYYDEMGYKAIVVYNSNGYSISELPLTGQLTDYLNAKTFTSKEALLDAVRINLLNRNTNVTLKTNRKVMEQIGSRNSIYNLVVAIDKPDTAKDADYLSLIIDKFGQRWQSESKMMISPNGSTKEIKTDDDPALLTINVVYETNLEQEAVVDAMIASIIKELKLDNATDYQKVKLIHDYVINTSSYDTSLMRSSAYELLVEKSAVCEGYALVAYRLFLAAGLDSRIISGWGDGQPHAWNIVKVDGKWYNIDLTWDDPVSSNGRQLLRYDYFLKSDSEFVNHVRNPEYRTVEFYAAYPMAKSSYPMTN